MPRDKVALRVFTLDNEQEFSPWDGWLRGRWLFWGPVTAEDRTKGEVLEASFLMSLICTCKLGVFHKSSTFINEPRVHPKKLVSHW